MKNKKRHLSILISVSIVVLFIFITVLLIKNIFTERTFKKYSASIIVETVSKGDSAKTKGTIDIKDDGKIAEVTTSFITSPIYIDKKGIFYEDGGRFNKVISEYSYRDIYKLLADYFKNYEDGNHQPEISEEIINKLLDCLFIDYEINRSAVGNLTVKDDKIEEFSLYLRNFYGYEKVGVVIIFEELDENYEINSPIFYKDAIDEIDDRSLRTVE